MMYFDHISVALGMRNRSVGSHRMNDYSSRSHTILTVHITSELQAEGGVFISKQGKINFVDLAGSEMTKKTNSEGKTLEEANNINKSLMVLGMYARYYHGYFWSYIFFFPSSIVSIIFQLLVWSG